MSKLKLDFLKSKKKISLLLYILSSYEQDKSRLFKLTKSRLFNNIVCPGTLSYQIQVINMTKKNRAKKVDVSYEINRIL